MNDVEKDKGKYPVFRLMMWLRFKRLCWRFAILSLVAAAFAGLLYAIFPIDEMITRRAPPTGDFNGDDWMAVLGDSSITGAAAHPSLQATWPVFGEIARDLIWRTMPEQHLAPNLADYLEPKHFGVHVPLEVTRVFYAPEEAAELPLPLLNAQIKAALKLDNEEYSFAYLVGRRLGYEGRRIVFAAQDGAQVNQLGPQLRRLRAIGAKTLPPLALVSFVANDMCDPERFAEPTAEFGARFRETVRAQFAELAKMPPHAGGTRVVYVAPLDLANILSNEALLAQQVHVDVDLVRCGDLRAGNAVSSWLGKPIAKILAGECPALLGPGDPKERLEKVRALQAEQVRILAEETAAFAKIAPPTLKLDLARSPREATFQTGDLAGDCFHPSLGGHTRIANALLANEFREPVEPILQVIEEDEAEPEP